MSFDPESIIPPGAKIKVIGIGGGGGNAVNTMIKSSLEGVDFIAANTDIQSLRFSLAPYKLQLGKELTKGLGAGADPDVGRDAALEDRRELEEFLTGADMVFITAGMGGGTGTGGASVVAQIARELGALTVAVVTKPFLFEGKRRRKNADHGIARLRESVDTLITIPNQRLLQVATPSLSMIDAFKMADDVLVNAVRGISDIINIPGIVNVDFADVKTVMASMGQALMGIGTASGPNRAIEAAKQAICSPLLEDISIEGATGILINITAGQEITLMEVNEACSIIQEAAHEDANIIIGAVIDNTVGEAIRVTVIATGFPLDDEEQDLIETLRTQTPKPITRPIVQARPMPPMHAAPTPATAKPAASAPAAPTPPARPIVQGAEAKPASSFGEFARELTDLSMQAREPLAPTIDSFAMSAITAPISEPRVATHADFDDLDVESMLANVEMTSNFAEPDPAVAKVQEPRDPERSEEPRPHVSLAPADEPNHLEHREGHFGQPVGLAAEQPKNFSPTSRPNPVTATSVADQVFFDGDDEPAELADAIPADAAPPAEGADAPLESMFDSDFLMSDIDSTIDAALSFAEKLQAPEEDGDDLDVPAFLRNSIRELPVGK
jgi:cell division protein FtsZ